MKIESIDNQLTFKEVYNSITLETKEGNQLHICMRDFGFEMKLNGGKWHLIQTEDDFKDNTPKIISETITVVSNEVDYSNVKWVNDIATKP